MRGVRRIQNDMKRIIFITLIAVLGILSTQAQILQGTPMLQLSAKSDNLLKFKIAADGSKFQTAIYKVININESAGTGDIEFTIYNDDLSIAKRFTIKGIYKFNLNESGRHVVTENVETLSAWGADIQDLLISKGMFTNDDKWCVMTCKYGYNQGLPDQYSVYNEDGKKLGDLDLGDAYPDVIYSNAISGKPYFITVSEYYGSDSNQTLTVYSFNGTSGLKAPAIVSRSTIAWPNPLPQSATLTIDFGREAPAGTFIIFSDMRGRVVEKENAETGVSSMTISPRVARGAYIYTVYFGDGEVTTGKLIAD